MLRRRLTVCAVALGLVVSGCTSSPAQQESRERKAAGVRLFRLHCTGDLWNRTGGQPDSWGPAVKAKVTDEHNGLVQVDLTGPQLVDLLRKLDYKAHGGAGNHDPLADRMYNAIAPRVDAIKEGSTNAGAVPEVTINDAPSATTPSVTPTVSTTNRG